MLMINLNFKIHASKTGDSTDKTTIYLQCKKNIMPVLIMSAISQPQKNPYGPTHWTSLHRGSLPSTAGFVPLLLINVPRLHIPFRNSFKFISHQVREFSSQYNPEYNASMCVQSSKCMVKKLYA